MTTTENQASPGDERPGCRGKAPARATPATPPSRVAPLVLQMEDICLWILERVAKFPRDHRFTLGDRLIEVCLSILDDLADASFRRDKVELLLRASRGLTRARTLVRLAHRAGVLSEAQRTFFAERTDEIGRRLGAWTRQSKAR